MGRFEPPPTTFVKGVGFNSAMEYAERELGRSEVQRRLQRLGEERGEDYEMHRLTTARVPLASAAAAWMAVAEMHGGSRAELRDFFQRMGVHIADSNLRRAYKTLMAFMVSPERLSKIMPLIWKTYFLGVEVKVDLSEMDRGIARCFVVGFGGAPHIGEMAEGWIAYSYDLCGALHVNAYEEGLELGMEQPDDEMAFTIRWEVV